MKKISLIPLLVIILIISISSISIALDSNPLEKEIKTAENLKDKIDTISEKDKRNNFIAEEWTYFLNKSNSGKIIIKISEGVKKTSPFWKLVLGVEYALSLTFFLALGIWFILFMLLLPPSEIILKNRAFAILASFAVTSLIGLAGVISKTTDTIGKMINNKWIASLSLIIAILLIFVAKSTSKFWKNLKKKEAEKEEEKNRKVLEAGAENVRNKAEEGGIYDNSDMD